jgi:hypothetical protein
MLKARYSGFEYWAGLVSNVRYANVQMCKIQLVRVGGVVTGLPAVGMVDLV